MNLKNLSLQLAILSNASKKLTANSFVLILSQDIGTVYQIFADEVLGSGQFGVVYGGAYVSLRMDWEIEQDKKMTPDLKASTKNQAAVI